MKEKKLSYGQMSIPGKKKGKAKLFFDKFKGHLIAGGVSLLLVGGAAGCGPSNGNCHPVSGGWTTPSNPSPPMMHCSPPSGKKYMSKKKKLELTLIVESGNGSLEDVKELIEKGVNVNAKSDKGWTPLLMACSISSNPEKYEKVKLLVENGADVNVKDEDGKTPLMKAAIHGDADIVKLLVESGADVNAKDKKGKTALAFANEKNKDIAEYLKEHGAK